MGRRGGVSLEKLFGIAICSSSKDASTGESKLIFKPEVRHLEVDAQDTSSFSDCSSSENENEEQNRDINVPECRSSWSQVPSREQLRIEASSSNQLRNLSPLINNDENHTKNTTKAIFPHYAQGDQLITDIATSIAIPLPLALCRALFLDSTSPLIRRWEVERGDINYSRTPWNFPPSSPRHLDNGLPENVILSNGSMQGGHRTVLFDRLRNGEQVRLSETIVVLLDDDEMLSISVSERMPRRGFSTKVRISLTKDSKYSCLVSVFADIVPIGKDLTNQEAVHRAFLLVVEELKDRYGTDNKGE
jgi:hypothetical protein